MTIRVILADNHKILLDAFSLFLGNEKNIKIIGAATDGREALELAATLQPDVVVLDVEISGMNAIEVSRRLLAEHPKIKIIALSYLAYKNAQKILKAGASAYIIKENSGKELVLALHAVMKGQKYLCPEVAAAVANNTGYYNKTEVRHLGRRECEVLQHLSEGGTSPMIAKRMFISTSTVDVHRRNIMKKLDLHSIAELTKYAVRNGLTSN